MWHSHLNLWKFREMPSRSIDVLTAMAAKALFQLAEYVKCRRISQELISWGLHSSLKRERKIRRRVFKFSLKRSMRHFHAVIVQ